MTKFAIRNLSVDSWSNGKTSWSYKVEGHRLSFVMSPGYFDDARDMMGAGDRIDVWSSNGEGGSVIFVTTVKGGIVTVAPPVDLREAAAAQRMREIVDALGGVVEERG
jgi:hypothetical protein